MFLIRLELIIAPLMLVLLAGFGCSTPKPQRVLTISEQIEVDTETASDLFGEYQKKVAFVNNPEAERYLNALALKIANTHDGLQRERVRVRIHHDEAAPGLSFFFSFPGTTLSVPLGFLRVVEYENELAGAIAFEIANVMNRHLAKKMDHESTFEMFGPRGLFAFDRSERLESIELGTRLLYYSGYDIRGLASFFQRYSRFTRNAVVGPNEGLDSAQKEVDFNVREAQRAKSEYLPSLQPVVRSAEFIIMKKGLKR